MVLHSAEVIRKLYSQRERGLYSQRERGRIGNSSVIHSKFHQDSLYGKTKIKTVLPTVGPLAKPHPSGFLLSFRQKRVLFDLDGQGLVGDAERMWP